MTDADIEELREIAKRNFEMISKSACFWTIFSDKMVDEVVPVIQLGLAILLDKPIMLLAPKGVRVPEHLQRLAIAIEEFERGDAESLKQASLRLAAKVTQ